MIRQDALTLLDATFNPELVHEYLEQTLTSLEPDYWSLFPSSAVLLEDVRLFSEALTIQVEVPSAG